MLCASKKKKKKSESLFIAKQKNLSDQGKLRKKKKG